MNCYRRPIEFVVAMILIAGSDVIAGIGDFFKSAGNVVVKTVTAPTEALINAAQVPFGKPPSTVLDPVKELGAAHGSAIKDGANLVGSVQNTIYSEAQNVASKAGAPGEFVFDVATFSQRYQDQWMQSTAMAAGNTLQGQNPLQFVGIPLAAAIRAGRESHIGRSKPLPDDVRTGLAPFFPSGVLDRARWSVGRLEITLPNGIGKTQAFGDAPYAVTVDDVIVFNQNPPSFSDGAEWWAHEVTHVEQYLQLGVDEFARRYVFSGGADLETPARERGEQVEAHSVQRGIAIAGKMQLTQHASEGRPLLPAFAVQANVRVDSTYTQVPPVANIDPPIIQCVFPTEPRPFAFYGTKAGRIIVVDMMTGQWMHIGFALPPQIPNVAWHYQAGGVFYDVFPNGAIVQRFTPYGPQQVGHVIRLQ